MQHGGTWTEGTQRARALRLSQRKSISPPSCKSPSSDSWHSAPASLTRLTIQGRCRLPALPATKPWCRSPPNNTAAYEPGVGSGESPGTSPTPSANRIRVLHSKTNPTDTQQGIHTTDERDHHTKQPTLREWSEVAAQLTSIDRETSRMFERHTTSLESTMQGLRPCLAMVDRTLERLDERYSLSCLSQRGPAHRPESSQHRGQPLNKER